MAPPYIVTVVVRKKKGLQDPQKITFNKALKRIGICKDAVVLQFSKYFEIKVSAENENEAIKKIELLSEELLSNPIIEDFEILKITEADETE
jgi:phosphoribosylformylglycinamidine synthase